MLPKKSRAEIKRPSANLAASALMLSSFVSFASLSVLTRMIGSDIAVSQVTFLRQIITMLLLLPLFWRARGQITHPKRLWLHILRGILTLANVFCGFVAVLYIPLAKVQVLQLTEGLFLTVLGALVLKERVSWRRWVATATGCVGIVVVLRPSAADWNLYGVTTVLGAACAAWAAVTLKISAQEDSLETVLFWQSVTVLAITGPLSASFWITPTYEDALVIVAMGFVFTLGQWLFSRAMYIGEANALAPLHYLRLILMALIGYLLYGEIPDGPTVIGSVLIILSASYAISQNARRI